MFNHNGSLSLWPCGSVTVLHVFIGCSRSYVFSVIFKLFVMTSRFCRSETLRYESFHVIIRVNWESWAGRVCLGVWQVGDIREQCCLHCVKIYRLRYSFQLMGILWTGIGAYKFLGPNQGLRRCETLHQCLLIQLRSSLSRLRQDFVCHIDDLLDPSLRLYLGFNPFLSEPLNNIRLNCGWLVTAPNLDSSMSIAQAGYVVFMSIELNDVLILE